MTKCITIMIISILILILKINMQDITLNNIEISNETLYCYKIKYKNQYIWVDKKDITLKDTLIENKNFQEQKIVDKTLYELYLKFNNAK